jgi:ADP-heptose:LPS heptosyltransferase
MSALGDIIHALPALDFLHRVVPGIEIDWVVEEPFRELLEEDPLISRLSLPPRHNLAEQVLVRGGGWVQLGKALLQTYPESSLLLTWGNEAEREAATAIATA